MSQVIASFSSFSLHHGKITQSGELTKGVSYTSIPLRSYSSATMTKHSTPLLVFLSIVALIGAVYLICTGSGFSFERIFNISMYKYNDNSPFAGLAALVAVYLLYRYFKSRRASLIIETIGGMQFSAAVSGDHDGVENFIKAIEKQYEYKIDLDKPEIYVEPVKEG